MSSINDLMRKSFIDGRQNAMNFHHAVVVGLIPNHSRIATLGNNPDVDTSTQPEDVWAGASLGILNGIDHKDIPIPQSAVAMELVSDSASDTAAGAGARTVLIGYLDSSRIAKTTVLTLNGTTPVSLPENVLRINTFLVATNGTFRNNNIGNLSIRAAGGLGATYAYIPTGIGTHRTSLISTPDNTSFDIFSVFTSLNRSDTQDRWGTFTLANMNSAGRVIYGLEYSVSSATPYRHEAADVPLVTIPENSDHWIRCLSVNLLNVNCTAGAEGYFRPQ